EQALWWRRGWRPLDDPRSPDLERLTIGTVDGEILGHVRIGTGGGFAQPGSEPPFVVGPRMGMILYGIGNADGAELRLFDANAEEDRLLVTTRSLLFHAALAPASGYAYFATGPGDAGIWRVTLDGAHPAQLVAEPPEVVGVRADAVLTAPITSLPKQVTLLLDDNEEHLAVFTCTDSCLLRVYDLRTDHVLEIGDLDPGSRVITDFIDGVVVIDAASAFDIETGRPVPEPDAARTGIGHEVGWELPLDWRIEERPVDPNARIPGPTHFMLIDPEGNASPIEVMGQGVGQG
ncbi:MAG: hypothetical protein M3Y29_07210, partial [Chloroflexota bacterium]|nr:hypothetical protein [Chloroflexota bacterium]